MLARRMGYLESSGIRKMFEMVAKMKDPIDLSLGQADFAVPDNVKKAAIRAIEEDKNGYSVTQGVAPLCEAITKSLKKEGVSPESVMATAGASGGLVLALLALADEDVDVLLTDPSFVTYGHLVRLTGSNPRRINTYPDFRLTPEILRDAIRPRSKILLFNSPVNPTGISYTPAEIKALAETAKELKLQVISDEVYDQFSYDHPHECWLKHDPTAILVRAFSKSCGAAGWRAGYVAGPRNIVDQMNMLQQFTFVCVNTPSQWAAIEALQGETPNFLDSYRKKRDFVVERLSGSFAFQHPQGAFYVFPEYPKGDGEKFMAKCIEKEILVVPGKAFGTRNSHFRVSFATDDKTLERGLDGLVKIAKSM